MNPPIPIIDLFAGPGGLGEGFSSLDDRRAFEIRLSIEKDFHAHQTLELRAFFRQFPFGHAHSDYYRYLRDEITRDELFDLHDEEAKAARDEAWHHTLGDDPDEVQSRIGLALDGADNWVLIGGPPCQAYSVVGRSRMMSDRGDEERGGKSFESDHRHLLYIQYLRVIAQHRPPVFVMENVRGLLSASLNGESMFDQIVADLKSPAAAAREHDFGKIDENLRYEVYPVYQTGSTVGMVGTGLWRDPREFLVKAEGHGVPQARHRVILIGLRKSPDPVRPPGLESGLSLADHEVSVRQVIEDLPPIRSRISPVREDSRSEWVKIVKSIAGSGDAAITDAVNNEIQKTAISLDDRAPDNFGGAFVEGDVHPEIHGGWYHDPKLDGGVCNHMSRSHMKTDLTRYFFCAVYAKVKERSPTLADLPIELMPNHKSARSRTGFADRFRVQIPDRPATTVTSHIAKDGHAFIHYDPFQCRSLTVREAARIQTFKDNYFFEGPRTSQYTQVGNAVPPYLAKQIARYVADTLAGH